MYINDLGIHKIMIHFLLRMQTTMKSICDTGTSHIHSSQTGVSMRAKYIDDVNEITISNRIDQILILISIQLETNFRISK